MTQIEKIRQLEPRGKMERWRFMVKIYIVLNILRLQKKLFLGVARKNRSVFKIPVVFFQQGIWLREFTGKLRNYAGRDLENQVLPKIQCFFKNIKILFDVQPRKRRLRFLNT